MKNTVKGYNIKDNTIILTKAFAKRAFTPGTVEFRILSQLHNAYPDMPIMSRTIVNQKEDKEKHEGLNIGFMKRFITTVIREEKAIKEFEMVDAFYKNTKGYYGKVKSWFLKKYPNYQDVDFTELIANMDDKKQASNEENPFVEMINRNSEVSNELSVAG